MFIYYFLVIQVFLVQISLEDYWVVECFEVYYKGIELVNGFYELIDVYEQCLWFEQDNCKCVVCGFLQQFIDNNLLVVLEVGLLDCFGVVLGVDCVVMLVLGVESIGEVIVFMVDCV